MFHTQYYYIILTITTSFITPSNLDTSINPQEHNLPTIHRTESTKSTFSSFTKLKSKFSSIFSSICKCFQTKKQKISSLEIDTENENTKNKSHSSMPVIQSSLSHFSNTPSVKNKPTFKHLEELEHENNRSYNFLSPQTVTVRKKHNTLYSIKLNNIASTYKPKETNKNIVQSLKIYLGTEQERLYGIAEEMKEDVKRAIEGKEFDAFQKHCLELYQENINLHISQIDGLQEQIILNTYNKDVSFNKEKSIEITTPKYIKSNVNLQHFKASKQPKSAKLIKDTNNNEYHFPFNKSPPNIKTLKNIEEDDEELDYQYDVECSKYLEKEIEKKILHIKALESLINNAKAKQKAINKGGYICCLKDSHLISIVKLSLEIIGINNELKKEQKKLKRYYKKFMDYGTKKTNDIEVYSPKVVKGHSRQINSFNFKNYRDVNK